MDVRAISEKFSPLAGPLDERHRRLVFATEAQALGYAGIQLVHEAAGMARSTLVRGIYELAHPSRMPISRVRRPLAGRKPLVEKDPDLLSGLEALVEPGARGDQETSQRWTLKSVRVLSR